MSGAELARRAGMSPSKISKIEHGRVSSTESTIERISEMLKLPESDARQLLVLARRIQTFGTWSSYATPNDFGFDDAPAFEAVATEVAVCTWSNLPALLQSSAYSTAIAVKTKMVAEGDTEGILQFLHARAVRQADLWNVRKRYRLLFDEEALYKRIVGDHEMIEQLRFLEQTMSRSGSVVIRVIPRDVPSAAPISGPFSIADGKRVEVDNTRTCFASDDPLDVADAVAHFESAWALGVEGDEALLLVRKALSYFSAAVDRVGDATKFSDVVDVRLANGVS
jgi:transcriptional regulator with XRE-family HTH domain